MTVQDAVLGVRGIPTSDRWITIGALALVAFNILFNVTTWLAHAYLHRECWCIL